MIDDDREYVSEPYRNKKKNHSIRKINKIL